jgi:hypothetical protein
MGWVLVRILLCTFICFVQVLLFYGWQVIQFKEALAVVHLQLCWTVEHVTSLYLAPYLFCAVAFFLPVASCIRHK